MSESILAIGLHETQALCANTEKSFINGFGRAERFTVVTRCIEAAHSPLALCEHVAGIGNAFGSSFGLLGAFNPVYPIESRDDAGALPNLPCCGCIVQGLL